MREGTPEMRAIVDRLEGDVAVLEVDGDRYVDVPLAELPQNVCEGDVLDGEPGSWVERRPHEQAFQVVAAFER